MSEGNNTEENGNSNLKLTPAEKFGFLRNAIKERLPFGKKMARKSGGDPNTHEFNRNAMNFADVKLRSDLESETDVLTGLKNRRGWDNELKKKIEIAMRTKTSIVIIG